MTTISASMLQWICDYPGGARLSERFKSAFRIALAMVITYGISLAMDWDKAFWAALSVIFCSLATSGESINASIDRILGTAAAAVLALLIVAIFPQDRWLFLLSLSAVIAVCSYRMTGGSLRKSVWFNAGFNLPIVAMLGESGGSLAPATFDLAILRVQQTALGALVYSVVAMLVWPRRGDEDFINAVRSICRTQHQLFSSYIDLLSKKAVVADLDKPLAEVAGQLPALGGKLEGAAYDNLEVRRMAGAWGSHLRHVRALHLTLERWNSGFEELQGLDLQRYAPDWERFVAEVENCFQGVDRLLSGARATRPAHIVQLPLDEEALRELSLVQRAAVVSCRDQVVAIGALAASLFDSASSIRNGERTAGHEAVVCDRPEPWTIDLDRLGTTVRQTTALWVAFLTIIYVEGVPIAIATVALTNAFSMALGQMPHVPAMVMYKPVITGSLFGGVFYIFIMPHLSGFWEFGSLLFVAIFAVAYVFSDPRAALVKGLWMTMLVLIMGADNQQTYSFLVFADWFMVGILFVTFMSIAWHFPISFKPEDRLQAQFRRYWQSAAFLLADLTVADERGRVERWRRAFHEHQLTVLPARLRVWASALPPSALEDADRKRLDSLLRSLQLYSYRMQEMQKAYPDAMRLERISQVRFQGDILRDNLIEFMRRLAEDPATFQGSQCRAQLEQGKRHLKHRVEERLGTAELSGDEGQRVYRLLGCYRSLLQAFTGAVDELDEIDWSRLRESRF